MTDVEISNVLTQSQNYVHDVEKRISDLLDEEVLSWSAVDSSIADPLRALNAFFQGGGKRLRPLFCYLGFISHNADGKMEDLLNAGCALELLHTFALVHDDIMDRAVTRRSQPTVHKYLENWYAQEGYEGDIEYLSLSVAILTGDFAFSYADRFAHVLPAACMSLYDVLKIELFAGQQMDLDASYRSSITQDRVSRIAQYKSGKYTIERPLHLGVLLSGSETPLDQWSKFGSPLGEAFQLRDDVLGIFGNAEQTGKPVGDDLREGKFTLLVAHALDKATDAQREILNRRGQAELEESIILEMISIIESTGARATVESRIDALYEESLNFLKSLALPEHAHEYANYLARYVCWRES